MAKRKKDVEQSRVATDVIDDGSVVDMGDTPYIAPEILQTMEGEQVVFDRDLVDNSPAPDPVDEPEED